MDIIKTKLEDFSEIQDYPFSSNFYEVTAGIHMHYLEEGDKTAPVLLLLHGEPSWSYLYRHMIPPLVESGFRVIAPDLIGFGKSDKLANQTDYSFQQHIDWLDSLIQHLDLSDITLFCQDWGGLIGLRLVAKYPHLFKSVIASNTGLPIGKGTVPPIFEQWVAFAKSSPAFDIGMVLQNATTSTLSKETIAAYNLPFPTEKSKAGARIFPSLVPVKETMPEATNNQQAWQILKQFDKPFGTIFSDKDPITNGGEKIFQKLIPGCKDQHHTIISGGHFIQEDAPLDLVNYIIKFYQSNFE